MVFRSRVSLFAQWFVILASKSRYRKSDSQVSKKPPPGHFRIFRKTAVHISPCAPVGSTDAPQPKEISRIVFAQKTRELFWGKFRFVLSFAPPHAQGGGGAVGHYWAAPSAARSTSAVAGPDADPWECSDPIANGDLAYLLGPCRWPTACVWCGGRLRHNRLCVTLTVGWAVAMPFGEHKGRAVRELERECLRWLLHSGMDL